MLYFEKYIKYKEKYINLKNQIGKGRADGSDLPRLEKPLSKYISVDGLVQEIDEFKKYSEDFQEKLKQIEYDKSNSYKVTKYGECHRSIIGLNLVFQALNKNLTHSQDKYESDSIIDTIKLLLKESKHILLYLNSDNHTFFIEIYNSYIRILSLYADAHGFSEYMSNSVFIKHNYGKWFTLDDSEISLRFIQDINILSKGIDFTKDSKNIREQYEILDITLVNMWGVGLGNKQLGVFLSSFSNAEINEVGYSSGLKILQVYDIIDIEE